MVEGNQLPMFLRKVGFSLISRIWGTRVSEPAIMNGSAMEAETERLAQQLHYCLLAETLRSYTMDSFWKSLMKVLGDKWVVCFTACR